jgi:hypothetical protein
MAGIGEGKLKSANTWLKYMRDSHSAASLPTNFSRAVKVYLEFITNQIGNFHLLKT